ETPHRLLKRTSARCGEDVGGIGQGYEGFCRSIFLLKPHPAVWPESRVRSCDRSSCGDETRNVLMNAVDLGGDFKQGVMRRIGPIARILAEKLVERSAKLAKNALPQLFNLRHQRYCRGQDGAVALGRLANDSADNLCISPCRERAIRWQPPGLDERRDRIGCCPSAIRCANGRASHFGVGEPRVIRLGTC